MKVIHLHAETEIPEFTFECKDLPEKLGILSTIQHMHNVDELMNYLKKHGKKPVLGGQLLGCDQASAIKIKNEVDAFLYFGTGLFHPIGVAKKIDKPLYLLDPLKKKVELMERDRIEKVLKQRKGQYIKFLSSENIGVLISKKSGQAQVQVLLDRILGTKKEGKNFYFFIVDTLNLNDLENFPFVESWLNTMCPRIEEDLKLLNIEDLIALEREQE